MGLISRTRNPLTNFKFTVELNGEELAGFSRISGLGQSTEVISYREGGDSTSPRLYPGQTSWSPVVLERGLSTDIDMYTWAMAVHNVVALMVPIDLVKNFFVIKLHGRPLDQGRTSTVKKMWMLYNCWPSEFMSSDFDSMSSSVMIERMVLQNEGIVMLPISK